MFFAVILLTAIALITKRSFAVNFKNHSRIFILALIAAFHLWVQVTGLQYTSASNTGWIIGITPVFMALLGLLFFKEKLNFAKTSGIIIAFAGLFLLISRGDISHLVMISNKGDYLVLVSALTWSIYSIVNKKITVDYPPLMTILFLFIMMMIIIAPFTLNYSTVYALQFLSAKVWLAVIFLGLFCSGIAYVLWAQALKEMESTKVGAFLYFEPFVTVFAAWMILEEKLTLLMLFSGILITAGVMLVNLRPSSFKWLKTGRVNSIQ